MKCYHSLAWKELNAQKITFALITIAIVLSTMMTTAVGQSLGILQALREQQVKALNGYRYATFHNLTNEQKMLVEKDNRLSFVGSAIFLGTAKLKNSSMSLQIREYDERGLSAYPLNTQLSKGRLPQKAGEIALPKDALDYIGFNGNVGDTIKLDLRVSLQQDTETDYKYQPEFTLCGILKSYYLAYSSGIISGLAGQGTAKKLLPEKYQLYSTDFRTEDKRSFQKTVNDLAIKIGIPAQRIQYNWLYLSVLGIDFDKKGDDESKTSGFSYITVTGIMISALVLLAAGLVIYNILKISVSKRIREFGTLRAIGARKGQLYRLVAKQLILLCFIGIPVGTVLGVLSSQNITKAATSSFSPEIFMVQSTGELNSLIAQNSSGRLLPLIVSAIITLAFAFLAAMPAARYAARVSPITAINGKTGRIKRRNRKAKHIKHFEAFYARLNLNRNSGRTIITV
ncbi:MAG TPA: ABC transporter permease, partial [Clostridia bacterium]|nr:ABC transporter permease [Clostridia bacterium]